MAHSEYELQHALAWLSQLAHRGKESAALRRPDPQGAYSKVILQELAILKAGGPRDERDITETVLEELGFVFKDLGGESPYEMWSKHGIDIWNYNEEYWLVDLLDQACIHRQFCKLWELEEFFQGCRLSIFGEGKR